MMSRPELQKRLGSNEIGAVIETVVEAPQDDSGMTRLHFGNHTLMVPPIDVQHGGWSGSASPPAMWPLLWSHRSVPVSKMSLPAAFKKYCIGRRVDRCPPGHRLSLWARITRQSFLDLEIKPGSRFTH